MRATLNVKNVTLKYKRLGKRANIKYDRMSFLGEGFVRAFRIGLRLGSVGRIRSLRSSRPLRDIDDLDRYDVPLSESIRLKELREERRPGDFSKCSTVKDVLEMPTGTVEDMRLAVAALVDLKVAYVKMYVDNLGRKDIDHSPERMVGAFVDQLTGDSSYVALLDRFAESADELSPESAASALCDAHKLGLTFDHVLYRRLLERSFSSIESASLETLVKLTVAVKSDLSLRLAYAASRMIPTLLRHLERCSTSEEFYLITISMINIHLLVTKSSLGSYKTKLTQLLRDGSLGADNFKIILKTIQFLNLSHWSRLNVYTSVQLCELIKCKIPEMNMNEVILLYKVLKYHMEPVSLVPELQKKVNAFLEQVESEDRSETFVLLPDLLYCQMSHYPVKNRLMFKKIIMDTLTTSFPSMLVPLYDCIRFLKLNDKQICDTFWRRIVDDIISNCRHEHQLLQLCYKYMYFNNNLGGTYRNSFFEKSMMNVLFEMSKDGIVSLIPWKFSRYFSFMLAYGSTSSPELCDSNYVDSMVEKLERVSKQLDIADIFFISRGLSIFNKLKAYASKETFFNCDHLKRITKIMDDCILRFSSEGYLTMTKLNLIFKSYCNYNDSCESQNYEKIALQYCKMSNDELSSQLIKEAIYNFTLTNTFIVDWTENAIQYLKRRTDNVMSEVVKSLIYLCFTSGYCPKDADCFNFASDIIDRDKEIISSLSLIHACIALCHYGSLSEKTVNYIFSLDFMERLDTEIENCYSITSYPKRVRDNLMILNRAVCLESPQHNIPWFHQKYIEEKISFKPFLRSYFGNDVLKTLHRITNSGFSVKKSQHSPYGHFIDFYLQIDRKRRKIVTDAPKSDDFEKVAILLLSNNSFVKSFQMDSLSGSLFMKQIKNGVSQMRSRHLELLGYRVIEIAQPLWNSMHMAEPEAKYAYLYDKLFDSRSV